MTTIVAVRRDGQVAMAGDGQVTLGESIVMKNGARKVRRLYHDQVVTGFAGSVADAFNLYDKFEARLEQYRGNLTRAAVELTKDWRTDKMLRNLEAMMIVASKGDMLILSGTGEVIEPDDDVAAIGSGGCYALAAARALLAHTNMSAEDIAKEALTIASNICVFTNGNIIVEKTFADPEHLCKDVDVKVRADVEERISSEVEKRAKGTVEPKPNGTLAEK